MPAERPQRGGPQTDLVGGARQSTGDRRQQEWSPDGLTGQGVHRVPVDADIPRDPRSDVRDPLLALDGVQHAVGLGRRSGGIDAEGEVEGLSVQAGGRGQMGQAGPEHGGGAQRGDGQDRAHQRRADGHGGAAASSFEGVADADQGTGRRSDAGQHGDRAGWTRHPAAGFAPLDPGGTDGGPQTQGQDDQQCRQGTEQQHPRIERESVGGVGQSRLTDGREGRQPVGQQDTTDHPDRSDGQGPGQAQQGQLGARDAERAQGGEGVCLDHGLAGQSLGHHDDPHQRGESGQDPPSDGLGSDGFADGGGRRVEVGHAALTAGLSGMGLEAREIGGPAAEPHEVDVEEDGPLLDGPCEGGGGVQVVRGAVGGRELVLGCLETHHPEGEGGSLRRDVGAAQGRTVLRRRGERDTDDRPEVDADVTLHREGGQHLVGVGRVGHATGHQFDLVAEGLRPEVEDPEVLVAQGPASGSTGASRCPG